MRTKFLYHLLRKGDNGGGGVHYGDGGCDGCGRVNNDDDKKVPRGRLVPCRTDISSQWRGRSECSASTLLIMREEGGGGGQ